jgi:hypothetical protein
MVPLLIGQRSSQRSSQWTLQGSLPAQRIVVNVGTTAGLFSTGIKLDPMIRSHQPQQRPLAGCLATTDTRSDRNVAAPGPTLSHQLHQMDGVETA